VLFRVVGEELTMKTTPVVLVLLAALAISLPAPAQPTPTPVVPPPDPAVLVNVAYMDMNFTYLVDEGDALVLTFSYRIGFVQPFADQDTFFIPVIGDTLGTGATMEISTFNPRQVVVWLGVAPQLTIPGQFFDVNIAPGSSSGLDISALMTGSIVDIWGRDVEDTGLINVDDTALDIAYAVERWDSFVSYFGGGLIRAGDEGVYYQHTIEVPPLSVGEDTLFTLESGRLLNISSAAVSPATAFIGDVLITLEYKDFDVFLEDGFVAEGMRVHEWNPDLGVFELLPGPQFVDLAARMVTVPYTPLPGTKPLLDLLGPAQGGGGFIVFGNVGIPTVVRSGGSAGPSGKPQDTEYVLSVLPGGLYTKHQLVVPGYTAGPGITFTIDQVPVNQRHGYGYDAGSATYIHHAIISVTATAETLYTDRLVMEYKDASNPNWSDIPSGADEASMQIYAWDGISQSWVELSGAQTVDTANNTVAAPIPNLMRYQLFSVQPGQPETTGVEEDWKVYR